MNPVAPPSSSATVEQLAINTIRFLALDAVEKAKSGHPGMPQECYQWEHNVIASNNFNPFTKANQDYCIATPFVKRRKTVVCPQIHRGRIAIASCSRPGTAPSFSIACSI